MDSPWLTVQEGAEYAKVSRRTMEAWLRSGLRHAKVGRTIRIRQEWVDQFLEAFSEQDNAAAIVEDLKREMGR